MRIAAGAALDQIGPMLCFLPPLPAALPPPPDPGPRRPGPRAAAGLVVTAFALLAPFGWAYSEPRYTVRAGIPMEFGPRPEDLALHENPSPRSSIATGSRVRAAADASVPPGLAVDGISGALRGTPSTPGTYTLAFAVDRGGAVSSGPSFRIVVLPSTL